MIHKMIQTIFFDLGKVLADFNWKSAAQKIAADSAGSPEEIYALCTVGDLALEYETGKIETNIFFNRLKDEIGFNRSPEILRELWSDIFTPIPKHLDVLDRIRARYPVGLISNTNEAHVDWITKKFGFLKWFPKPTYSFTAGFLKPQKEIFQIALKTLSSSPEESLFIDDLEVNIAAAKSLGMQAIHLTPDKDIEKELKKFDLDL